MISSRWIALLVVIGGLAVSCGSGADDGSGDDGSIAATEPTTAAEPTTAPQATTEATDSDSFVEPTPRPLAIICAEGGNSASETGDFAVDPDDTNDLSDAVADFVFRIRADPDDVELVKSSDNRAMYHYSVDGVVLAIGFIQNIHPAGPPFWVNHFNEYCPTTGEITESLRLFDDLVKSDGESLE